MSTLRVRQALLLMLLLMTTAVCSVLEVPYLSGRVVDNACSKAAHRPPSKALRTARLRDRVR